MGFLTKLACIGSGLIGTYALLHDIAGLNIINFNLFDNFLAPLFVVFLFVILVSVFNWVAWILTGPPSKKIAKVTKIAVLLVAGGIFFTAIPLENTTTLNLLMGKLLLLLGVFLGYAGLKTYLQKTTYNRKNYNSLLKSKTYRF